MLHPEPVEILADDGLTLRGQLWDRGRHAALLVHQPGGDLDRWRVLAGALEQIDLSVLAVDLRGHGLSDGTWSPQYSAVDIAAAMRWLRQRYAGGQIVISEGASADETINIADEGEIAALVLFSPCQSPGLKGRECLCPKLLIVGGSDAGRMTTARQVYDHLLGPRLLVDLPTQAQGADLLGDEFQSRIVDSVVAFLAAGLGMKRKSEVGG